MQRGQLDDDYGDWKSARKALDEFLIQREIHVPFEAPDYSGRFLIKPEPDLDVCNKLMKWSLAPNIQSAASG